MLMASAAALAPATDAIGLIDLNASSGARSPDGSVVRRLANIRKRAGFQAWAHNRHANDARPCPQPGRCAS